MRRGSGFLLSFGLAAALAAQPEAGLVRGEQAPGGALWLESIDLTLTKSLDPPLGYPARAARSVAGKPLTINGVVYPHGVGMHSGSKLVVELGGDIRDSWESIARIGFSQNGLEKWAGPGRWNDPGMLVIAKLGWGLELHATRLPPHEQLTHITLWSLLAAPLLLGCDLAQLDRFTIDLLTNDEVLEINQDPLGRQAARRAQDGLLEVWSKAMSDGTVAAGLFNRGIEPATVRAKWSDLGLNGKQPVRDLWRRKELGAFEGAFETAVPAHGAVLVRVGRPRL